MNLPEGCGLRVPRGGKDDKTAPFLLRSQVLLENNVTDDCPIEVI
jgi:hypothetical protein